MSEIELRPRFKLYSDEPRDILMTRLKSSLSKEKDKIHGSALEHHAIIKLPQQDLTFWSPQLDIELEENDNGTTVRGLFGPRPNLWLLFMFIYMVCAILTFFALTIGFSQLSSGKPMIGFYISPIFILAGFTMHLVAKLGQKKSRHQISSLYNFIVDSMKLN